MASNVAIRGRSLSHILRFGGSFHRSSGKACATMEAISCLDLTLNRRNTSFSSGLLIKHNGIKRDDASSLSDLRIGRTPEPSRVFNRRALPTTTSEGANCVNREAIRLLAAVCCALLFNG